MFQKSLPPTFLRLLITLKNDVFINKKRVLKNGDKVEKESETLRNPLLIIAIILCTISAFFALFTENQLSISIGSLSLAVILIAIAGILKTRKKNQ